MAQLSRFLLIITFALSCRIGFSQTITQFIDEEYKVENVFGITKATHGGFISGFLYRHSRALNDKDLMHYGIEIVNIKHPRETNETTFTGSSFVFGKSNYLYSIRPVYGREKILFKKAPQQGARVTGMVAAGPTLGLEIPYFIQTQTGTKEQYDPNNPRHARPFIQGSTSPFKGLGQTQIVLGGHLKAALTFETNSTKRRVFGVEVGFTLDAYTREINILPDAENKSTYTSAYFGIYFGKRR